MSLITSKLKNKSFLTALGQSTRADETDYIEYLLKNIDISEKMSVNIQLFAHELIKDAREQPQSGLLRHFLATYELSSPTGITLMCLAESLLRIPDTATAKELLSTLTHNGLLAFISLPMVKEGVRLLGEQFVIGEDLADALKRSKGPYRYSYDMLGEAAKIQKDADRYFNNYLQATHTVGLQEKGKGPIIGSGISVKLSALHPRYHYTQLERLEKELVPKIIELASAAQKYGIGFTIDAEEAERLQLSLILIEKVLSTSELKGFEGFGLAVQAYQKAAPDVIDVCQTFATKYKHRLMLRLVKGAYWDMEIKRAQEQGFAQYPVYTRKMATDVNYLLCAQKLLKAPDVFYPQFATHNAYTVSAVLEMAGKNRDFEFQRLYGMGEALYTALMAKENIACRVYAPVGNYQHLLTYLIRRILENGANSSFVHQIENANIPVDDLIADPIEALKNLAMKTNPDIPTPPNLYGDLRRNSIGFDLSDFATREYIMKNLVLQKHASLRSDRGHVDEILTTAEHAFLVWSTKTIQQRAQYLHQTADLLVKHEFELMSLLIQEGKKTILDAQSEVREAIDYCRYYATEAEKIMAPQILPGPSGEQNTLSLHARGIAVCISPWNFPLAIFLGQIVAALVTGNTVIAKPASLTPQIAIRTVALLHQAGIPKEVLQLVIGKSKEIGDKLTQDPRVAVVAFTGSLETAQHINRNLAARSGAIARFIAETGGQNAMIVDSSALLEQVVTDVISSAFNSAGQRCSSLRILCVQEEIFAPLIEMLIGAMAELSLGNPQLLSTDIGPVIDTNAQSVLNAYIEKMKKDARLIYQAPLPEECIHEPFVAPCLFEINDIKILTHEVFGPVLHVIRYQKKHLPKLIQALNETHYGLTLGIHSRIEPFTQAIIAKTFVGNNYVNRNMIGAVVGVQPFGGQHHSGTGPKAGGPNYLSHFLTEKTLTVNTAALGGNPQLLK